jgi:peroxiredoxin
MIRTAAAVVLAAMVVIPVTAGQFNKKISVGDAAPTFTSLPGVDGKEHGLADFKKDVVVVFITCNKCPVAVAYEDRIIALAKKFGDKADFVAINVNTVEADGLPKMKERANEKGFNFPYLYDESQKIGRELGASVTPEFFVLNKDRKIVYTGALDDNMDASKVKNNYLDDAITAALKGETPVKTETRAFGCGVGYHKN